MYIALVVANDCEVYTRRFEAGSDEQARALQVEFMKEIGRELPDGTHFTCILIEHGTVVINKQFYSRLKDKLIVACGHESIIHLPLTPSHV